jgi:hypothetical protein
MGPCVSDQELQYILFFERINTYLQPNKKPFHTGSIMNTAKHERMHESSSLDALSLDRVTILDRSANHNQSRSYAQQFVAS